MLLCWCVILKICKTLYSSSSSWGYKKCAFLYIEWKAAQLWLRAKGWVYSQALILMIFKCFILHMFIGQSVSFISRKTYLISGLLHNKTEIPNRGQKPSVPSKCIDKKSPTASSIPHEMHAGCKSHMTPMLRMWSIHFYTALRRSYGDGPVTILDP